MAKTTLPPVPDHPVSVLFICLGNICRSPMAEAVFKNLYPSHPGIARVDSAGLGPWHVGQSPDERAMWKLNEKGIHDYLHRGRQVSLADFHEFDYILGMDDENMESLQRMARRTKNATARVLKFGEFGGNGEEVVDPYYGHQDGFEVVYHQIVKFSRGFAKDVADKVAAAETK